jgi:hypothetical protein
MSHFKKLGNSIKNKIPRMINLIRGNPDLSSVFANIGGRGVTMMTEGRQSGRKEGRRQRYKGKEKRFFFHFHLFMAHALSAI